MSTAQTTIRPAFSSEVEDEALLSKPISKIAIASFVLGLSGLLAPLSPVFLPVALVATLLGLGSSVMLARKSSNQSGGWLANAGLVLGLTCSVWSGLSSKLTRERTAEQAGQYAAHFVETLAKGEFYKAAELQIPPGARQLPGLDLKEYYESYQGSTSDDVLKGANGSPDPRAIAKRRYVDLKEHLVTRYAAKYPQASWKLVQLVDDIYFRNNLRRINVILCNSEKPADKVEVVLERQEFQEKGKALADWYVKDLRMIR